MTAVEWPETSYGWGALAFIVVVLAGRAAYWITDRRKKP